jgi:ubiquinone biosynthesis monooxygenase Coq7
LILNPWDNSLMNSQRQYSPADQIVLGINGALQTLFASPKAARPYPGSQSEPDLTDQERRKSAGYMRVNHVGEICAQALYHSQALTATNPNVKEQMKSAAAEETDHLAWCEQRLGELDSHKSLLNPLWYGGAFAIGVAAGLAGDQWNLGFVAETERQVVQHLESHLAALPEQDLRSREVVAQMQQDEAAHAVMAVKAGAENLPGPVKGLMKLASGAMTRIAYWI